MPGAPTAGVVRALALAAALVPILHTLTGIARWGLPVPFEDAWALVPHLERIADGTFSLADLWERHNTHRIVLPRAALLALAWSSGWSLRLEMAVNLLLAAGSAALLLRALRATGQALGATPSPWVGALGALLVFSFAQWECWTWGWSMSIFLAVLLGQGALAALAAPGLTPARLGAAVALAAGASLSLGGGLAVWPAGALVLATPHAEDRVGRRARLLVWGAGALLLALCYAGGGGQQIAASPRLLLYVATFLGAPAAPHPSVAPAALAGVAGVVALGLGLARLGRGASETARRRLAFWAGLGTFALAAGGLAGLGRAELFGAEQALESRYVTLATPLWLAVAAVGGLAAAVEPAPARRRWSVALAAVALLAAAGAWRGGAAASFRHDLVVRGLEAVAAGNPRGLRLLATYTPPEVVAARIEALRRLRLAGFSPAR